VILEEIAFPGPKKLRDSIEKTLLPHYREFAITQVTENQKKIYYSLANHRFRNINDLNRYSLR
jgi:hypothetical protein